MGNQISKKENNWNGEQNSRNYQFNLQNDEKQTQIQQQFDFDQFQNIQKSNFLKTDFLLNKRASKKIQFQINQQTSKTIHNSIYYNKNHQKQNLFQNETKNTDKPDFIIQKTQSVIFGTINKNNKQINLTSSLETYNKDKTLCSTQNSTKSSLNSFSHQYRNINIKQSSFVKVSKTKFEQKYNLLEKIGEGAYGQVFKAKCLKTNNTRAAKILKKKYLKQVNQTEKLNTQLDILRSLDHPNIIKIYDVFQTQDHYYVVTQYCSGGNLHQYAKKQQNNIENKTIKIIMRQLLGALSYLHNQSIIHRDIKLQNIVFDVHPDSCYVQDIQIKIIDFGLSMKAKYKSFNKQQPYIGTPFYMAPQVLKGKYSPKTDIWCCGVIFYYLLTKQFPFKGFQIEEVYRKIQFIQPDFQRLTSKNVQEDVKDLLKNMFEKNDLKRINAQEALSSEWLKTFKYESKTTQKQLVFKKIQQYKHQNSLISFIESYLVHLRTNQTQRKKLIKLFQRIDKNNNGVIDITQLSSIYPNLSYIDQQKSYLLKLIQKIDKNGSGKIQISEFLTFHTDRVKLFNTEYLQQAFDYLDGNKNGFIDKKQLKKVLQGCQNQELKDLWNDIDKDHDQKISKKQFLQYLLLLEGNQIF